MDAMFIRDDFDFGNVKVHIMEFNDFEPSHFLDNLTEIEIERYLSFSHIQRKREFVASRMLRHEVVGFEHIHYDSIGAPYIKGEGYISISHTSHLVGIAVSEKFKLGLDIEVIRPKILNIQHKFLSVEELTFIDSESVEELTKVWTAKEALYKVSGRNGINFRTELFLTKKSEQLWEGKILENDSYLKTQLNIFDYKNCMIAINISELEKH
jgi:phosphopantetheinyl transferase